MAEFRYSARDEAGRRLVGRIEADDKNAALKSLSERYALVTQLDEIQPRPPLFGSRVSGEDLLSFSQALAAMVDGGIPLKRAMDVLYEDTESPALRNVIGELSTDLSAGKSLSAAMSAHPIAFDRFYVSMVRAGEGSGKLSELMNRLTDFIERTSTMKDKVQAAMIYPVIVVIFAVIMVSMVIVFGVPRLRQLYGNLGFKLPLATRVVVAVGGALAQHLLLLVLVALVVLVAARYFLSTPSGIHLLDYAKLKLPIVGSVFRLLYTARFARTLSTLYASGVPLLDALTMVADNVGNQVVQHSLLEARDRLEAGDNLSNCLRGIAHFSRMTAGMVSAGEESGNVDVMLSRLANFYEAKLYSALDGLAATVEPVLMIAVGICIGGVIIVMGLPFMNMSSLFTQ